jgi:phosphatidylinositol glycan class B
MALYYYPWHELFADEAAGVTKENPIPANSIIRRSGSLRACFALAALAIVLRPTNVLIWATVVGMTLARLALGPSSSSQQQQQHAPGLITVLFREALLCGSLVVGGSLVADRLYFGFWTFPPYNWLTFNISQSLAVFYGRNPWHYYLLQGLPLLSTTTLPFVLYGLYKPAPSSSTPSQVAILRTLSYAVFVTIGALSLISHKEVRFIYPLLPILNILAAPVAMRFITKPSSTPSPSGRVVSRKNLLRFGIGLNVALAGYLSMYHQSAPLSVLRYLRSEFERLQPVAAEDQLFALFLMPCHSTPWRSHLVHPNLQAYALSCEPPLNTLPNTPERDLYRDEADRFYDDPSGFLAHELFAPGQSLPIPRYIAGFEGIEPWITDFLDNTSEGRVLNMKLRPVWSGFNGLFHEDWRRAGRIIVWDTGVYSNPPKSLKLG